MQKEWLALSFYISYIQKNHLKKYIHKIEI